MASLAGGLYLYVSWRIYNDDLVEIAQRISKFKMPSEEVEEKDERKEGNEGNTVSHACGKCSYFRETLRSW